MSLKEDLELGLSLPASYYTDPAIVDKEREKIFRRTWQYIGRAELVAKPGDFMTGSAGDIPVAVVRNESGLSGFVNVCRHRRHEVLSGSGNAKVMQCPYHAWTYDLHGKLKGAPRCDREKDFKKEDFPLITVRVETWGPFVFVNASPEGKPLASLLEGLSEIISRSGLDLASLRFRERHEWVSDSNWKVMLENYLECYHCPIQHPGFSKVINVDQDTYDLTIREGYFAQAAPIRESALRADAKSLPYNPKGEVTEAQYHFIWPNFTININPGPANLSIDTWLPNGPNGSRGIGEYYFGPDVGEESQREILAFSKQVGSEDDALTQSVQRGMLAGIPAQGRSLLTSERLVVQFQRLVLDALS